MDSIEIQGGVPLEGTIRVSGAKNAALPLMAAGLLCPESLTLTNVPRLADITMLAELLHELGAETRLKESETGAVVTVNGASATSKSAPYSLVRKMRASILVLGPQVARFGKARVSLPGGCAIGTRPVDLHIQGLETLGARIELRDGYIEAAAPQGLKGAPIHFPTVSVGATENLLMAACLARGETVLGNAAREPEVSDLARCLVAMGADIQGIGTEKLVIRGVSDLHGAEYEVMPDRIEAGTYAVAAGITGGKITLMGARADLIGAVASILELAGVELLPVEGGLIAQRRERELNCVDVTTQPYPGFPTDMQAQIMALVSVARGASRITESIFENRFMHVQELTRMGADISVQGGSALVRGVDQLTGAPVMATDLRASVSLVLAGLAAEGKTVVNRVYHLDRGYEGLEEKLAACGANIKRVPA